MLGVLSFCYFGLHDSCDMVYKGLGVFRLCLWLEPKTVKVHTRCACCVFLRRASPLFYC